VIMLRSGRSETSPAQTRARQSRGGHDVGGLRTGLMPLMAVAMLVLIFGAGVLPVVDAASNPRWGPEEHQLARAYGIKEFDLRNMATLKTPVGCEDPDNSDFFSRFRTFEEIEDFLLNRLCRMRQQVGAQGSSCIVREIGRSTEDRPIYAVEIRNPEALEAAAANGKPERSILVTGTVHAREWTTTTSVLFSAAHINVLDVSVLLIPVVNPDGYIYTWSGKKNIKRMWTKEGVKGWYTEARLWRKNRARNRDGTYGVDLNRNFGSSNKIWGTDRMNKSLNITESDVFQGKHGFSEPETATINKYFLENKETIVSFYDVHCCIGALLEPFSRDQRAPEYVHDTGQVMIDAINTQTPATGRYAWRARPQSSASGTGISSSWAFQEAKIMFTYVIEIRGKFVSSCREIKPIGLETLYGLDALAKEMSRLDEILEEYKNGRPVKRQVPSLDVQPIRMYSAASVEMHGHDDVDSYVEVAKPGAEESIIASILTEDGSPSTAISIEDAEPIKLDDSAVDTSEVSRDSEDSTPSENAENREGSWEGSPPVSLFGTENHADGKIFFVAGGIVIGLAFFFRHKRAPHKRS